MIPVRPRSISFPEIRVWILGCWSECGGSWEGGKGGERESGQLQLVLVPEVLEKGSLQRGKDEVGI